MNPKVGISAFLAVLLCLQPVFAQEPPPPKRLKIKIVEGDESVNNVRQRVAREPIVQVEDENRKPVAGAVIVFFLPLQGSSASFPNGAQSLTAITDDAGRAVARGLTSNSVQGQYNVRVTASFRGTTGSSNIKMTNAGPVVAGSGLSTTTWLLIVAAAAGAAVAGAVVATSGGGSSSVSVGPPTVTPPR